MSFRIDAKTENLLRQYLEDVRKLPNEASKTTRFMMLVSALFPGSDIASRLAPGIEKAVTIQLPARLKRGSIDSYFGNAIIEFENSLKATGEHAKEQLREYCAGRWAQEGRSYRPLLALSSDGVVWNSYRPALPKDLKGKPKPEDVTLESLRSFIVSDDNLDDFWIWLNGFLFRQGEIIPSAEQFRHDFGRQSAAYVDAIDKLKVAWTRVRDQKEPQVAIENWTKYLKVTYGSLTEAASVDPDFTQPEELFLKHTYLASVAKLMIWASLSRGKTSTAYGEVVDEVFSGRFFRARNLANLVEDDFFQWTKWAKAKDVLTTVWEMIVAQIQTYDLRNLTQDVLKGVYQELVDPEDRHYLGEYYTPDWLCERMVLELLPSRGFVKVLDPACGSGSFLRATIQHFLDNNREGSEEEQLNRVLENVIGIDVHPLAVTVAKSTYLLVLGTMVNAARRPVQIPVYMADSLFLPTEVTQIRLGETFSFELRFGDKRINMPDALIHAPDLFDAAIAACSSVAIDHAAKKAETESSLEKYLVRVVPKLVEHPDRVEIVHALWLFADGLADLIRQKKNSIWSFIIRNSYKPAMLKEQFDVVIGNPPWLSYRYIELPEYQAEIKRRAVDDYRIAPKHQKLFTQMELATVFLAHSMGWFGKPGSLLGFVMPRSVLSADQHMNFRNRSYSWRCKFRLTSYWDLRDVKNLFNVPSCVVFTVNTDDFGAVTDPVPVRDWGGKLAKRDCHWAEASKQLSVHDGVARVIYLGKRTALSTEAGEMKATRSSTYAARFRQGATILPRAFYFVRSKDLTFPIDREKLYWIETDPETEKKKPYDDIELRTDAKTTSQIGRDRVVPLRQNFVWLQSKRLKLFGCRFRAGGIVATVELCGDRQASFRSG